MYILSAVFGLVGLALICICCFANPIIGLFGAGLMCLGGVIKLEDHIYHNKDTTAPILNIVMGVICVVLWTIICSIR